MKNVYTVVTFVMLIVNSLYCQDQGKLVLSHSKLSGDCDHSYFKGFSIELDTVYSQLDSSIIFSQLPRIGTINFKNKAEIATEFTQTNRAGFPQIMFRFRSNYLTFDNLEIDSSFITFSIDDDPEVPVTADDLEIIRLSKKILSDETHWHKNDDRICDDDLANKTYSLYCAIRIASLQIEGRYNHRNATLQKLRHLIDDRYEDKPLNHRLLDFNNMEETTFQDIKFIMNEIEDHFKGELEILNNSQ